MITFDVHDMTCGHCVAALTRAVQAAAPDATVSVDLATHRVQVESTGIDAPVLARAISEAGYTPVHVPGEPG